MHPTGMHSCYKNHNECALKNGCFAFVFFGTIHCNKNDRIRFCCNVNLLTNDADILNVKDLFVTEINAFYSNTCQSFLLSREIVAEFVVPKSTRILWYCFILINKWKF